MEDRCIDIKYSSVTAAQAVDTWRLGYSMYKRERWGRQTPLTADSQAYVYIEAATQRINKLTADWWVSCEWLPMHINNAMACDFATFSKCFSF